MAISTDLRKPMMWGAVALNIIAAACALALGCPGLPLRGGRQGRDSSQPDDGGPAVDAMAKMRRSGFSSLSPEERRTLLSAARRHTRYDHNPMTKNSRP